MRLDPGRAKEPDERHLRLTDRPLKIFGAQEPLGVHLERLGEMHVDVDGGLA